MMQELLYSLPGIVIGIFGIAVSIWALKRDAKASQERKEKAIEEASRSIASEAMLIQLRPNEPIYAIEKRATNRDGSLVLRIRKHLEKAFNNV